MEINKETYQKAEVVQYYGALSGLQPAESYLFTKYLPEPTSVLDLGVGGGRTTPLLSSLASEYIGLDYSAPMVEACRKKFPALQFVRQDAKDLKNFPDSRFGLVVFSFNGIDYFAGDQERAAALREIRRVLKPGGIFLFSTHHARHFLVWPELRGAPLPKKAWRLVRALGVSAKLAAAQIGRGSFWKKRGYFHDRVHGGLRTYAAVPKITSAEIESLGFEIVERVAGTYPQRAPASFVPWFYYAFRCRK